MGCWAAGCSAAGCCCWAAGAGAVVAAGSCAPPQATPTANAAAPAESSSVRKASRPRIDGFIYLNLPKVDTEYPAQQAGPLPACGRCDDAISRKANCENKYNPRATAKILTDYGRSVNSRRREWPGPIAYGFFAGRLADIPDSGSHIAAGTSRTRPALELALARL